MYKRLPSTVGTAGPHSGGGIIDPDPKNYDPIRYVRENRKIVAGTGLEGGGDLSADRRFDIKFGNQASTVTEGNDPRLSDAREWSAQLVSASDARRGEDTSAYKWSPALVHAAVAGYIAAHGGIGGGGTSDDAFLLDRKNHTGTQSIDTVEGLRSALDSANAGFNTFDEMLDADLVAGQTVRTLGFFIPGDAGQATYKVIPRSQVMNDSHTVDGVSVAWLKNKPDLAVLIQKPEGGAWHKNAFGNDLIKAANFLKRGHSQHPVNTLIIRDGTTWITETLDLTYINIIADATGQINVNPVNFNGEWAVTIGQDTGTWSTGRCTYHQLIGQLVVNCSSRNVKLNGVYRKGGWINHGHIRARNFNGIGIRDDSCHDSTFQRTATELCGNTVDYGYTLVSQGDTNNASHYVSIQTERAYHRSFNINVLRQVISNIHSERTFVLTDNDGTTGDPSGARYRNFYINATNSTLNQSIIDAQTAGGSGTPDGTPHLGIPIAGRVDLSGTTVQNMNCNGLISARNGYDWNYTACVLNQFHAVAPVGRGSMNSVRMAVFRAEREVQLSNCFITDFRSSYNFRDIIMIGGAVTGPLSFTHAPVGKIIFNGVTLANVADTKSAATTPRWVTFENCTMESFTGFFNAAPRISGGYIASAVLASRSKASFESVHFGSFDYTGDAAFLTRNCSVTDLVKWNFPRRPEYAAGTLTERLGYSAAGKIYQNTDGALDWQVLA